MVLLASLALSATPASAAPPEVGPVSVSNVRGASAEVNGTIDPGDEASLYAYQRSIDGINWDFAEGVEGFLTPGGGPQSAPGVLTGLQPNTKYFVRLMLFASPSNAFSPEPDASFITATIAPPTIVLANDATNVGNYTADVSGAVKRAEGDDPALDVSCRFEYISQASYEPRSERQSLRVQATGGTYLLNFEGEETSPIAFDAATTVVQAELEALAKIGPGNVSVNGGPGSASGSSPYTVAFTGSLANQNVAQIGADGSGLSDPGEGSPEVTTTTEGHAEGFETAAEAPCDKNPITAPGDTAVSARIGGLTPKTTYHLRFAAANAGGTSFQVVNNFKTSGAPVLQTNSAGDVADVSATLRGQINPVSSPVSYQFEWGPVSAPGDVTYESKAPATPEAIFFEDEAFHVVTTPLTGLSPATEYHYRIVATNTQSGESSAGVDRVFTTFPSPQAEPCPNESSRVGPSAGLPDCRAFEFVTPELNSMKIEESLGAVISGDAVAFGTRDAPANADGSYVTAYVVARRGPAGWRTESTAPGLVEPGDSFEGSTVQLVSTDFTEALVKTSQKLVGVDSPVGLNLYVRHLDGTYAPVSVVGPYLDPIRHQYVGDSEVGAYGSRQYASGDFSHIFFAMPVKQVPGDPAVGNFVEWADGDLRLLGILPNGTPAPNGAAVADAGTLESVSYDGGEVLFTATGIPGLFLRIDGKETVKVSASQRASAPDLEATDLQSQGISADGSTVLFTSRSELTDDANTGEMEAGKDLYSYDVGSEVLTDLTVDDDPADAATGANVRQVTGTSSDGSYVYFVATGALAPGGVSGEPNLYVVHGGRIDFVAPATGFVRGGSGAYENTYVTPDGLHAAFESTESLTGYDSFAPDAGTAMPEVFKYAYRGDLECASCRPSGEPPTGGSGLGGRVRAARPMSDDGSRVFFESNDQVLPADVGGATSVYEYSSGRVHLLSPGESSSPASLYGASGSGDDVFIRTFEQLSAEGEGRVEAIYDARVDADVFRPEPPVCSGEGCRGSASTPASQGSPGSAGFQAPRGISGPGSKSFKRALGQIRLNLPSGGHLSVSGKGLERSEKSVSKGGSVTISVVLKDSANRSRLRKGAFKTKVLVLFESSSKDSSRLEVALTFKGVKKKGGN